MSQPVSQPVKSWRWTGLLIAGVCTLLVPACSQKKEKVTMDRKSPQPPGPAPGRLLDHPLAVKWRAAIGREVVAAPAAADDLILVPSLTLGNVDTKGAVHAVDARTGALRWTFGVDGGLEGAAATTPAVAEGLVVFGTSAGRLYALHLETGHLAWHVDLGGALAAPTVRDGTVLVTGEDRQLHVFELRSGRLRWQASTGSRVYAPPALVGQEICVASEEGVLQSLGPDGTRWRLPLPTSMPVSVTAARDLVLVSGLSDRSLHAVDPQTREQVWTFTMKDDRPSFAAEAPIPVVANDLVCVGDADRLVGLDLETGQQRWSVATGGDMLPPLVADGVALAATRGGQLQAIDSTTGTVLWTRTLDLRISSGLLLHDGVLYFADSAGNLVAMAR